MIVVAVYEEIRTRVLVVENERNVRELISLHLRHEGYECDEAATGTAALDRLRSASYDLVVLDLLLPELGGVSLCRAVRNEPAGFNRDVPILIVTATSGESDKVLALESGADDYLTKPFGVRELVARSRALLRRYARRAEARAAPAPLRLRDLALDPARWQVSVQGHAVALTNLEFRLLYELAAAGGRVLSREELKASISGRGSRINVRNVDVLVKSIRQRIEPDPSRPRYLLTVRGVGYKVADSA